MHYKVLFLAMSCNDPFFIESRNVVHDTWAKDIIDGKFPDYGFYSYTASDNGQNYIEGNTIYLDCGDGIRDTFNKTMKCFMFLRENDITYDYIVRTNTSVYINVPLYSRVLNYINWSNIDYEGYTINSEFDSFYDNDKCAVLAGFQFVMSNRIINDIIEESKSYEFDYNEIDYGYDDFEMAKIVRQLIVKGNIYNINIINPFHQVKYKTVSKNKILRIESNSNEIYNVYHTPDIVNVTPVVQFRIKNLLPQYRYQELESAYELDNANIYKLH